MAATNSRSGDSQPRRPRPPSAATAREFALDVVETLRQAGFQSLWAGGCVRDLLLGRDPHDYDVATDARPEQVQQLFRRTLAVGAQFGVIEVLGGRPGLHVQVATFRSDDEYSDGRHPDSVRFGTAQADALRRDFTINGLFYDPIKEEVIDFVGGQDDLKARVIRAIGPARERLEEDKLRMLRAVRFVSRLGFHLDESTRQAIATMAGQVTQVSPERIADELRKMLAGRGRSAALAELANLRLLPVLLPEFAWEKREHQPGDFALSAGLPEGASFPLAWAAMLLDCTRLSRHASSPLGRADYLEEMSRRFRLSNQEREALEFLLGRVSEVRAAQRMPWSELKPILAHPLRDELLLLLAAAVTGWGWEPEGLQYCRERLTVWTREALDPAPLVGGDDIAQRQVPQGPAYRELLQSVRAAQLNEEITTREEGLRLLEKLIAELRLGPAADRSGE